MGTIEFELKRLLYFASLLMGLAGSAQITRRPDRWEMLRNRRYFIWSRLNRYGPVKNEMLAGETFA
jgi:hypothetical protein